MKLGRNDACHCGSGQKYKKCHAAADDAAKSADDTEQVNQQEINLDLDLNPFIKPKRNQIEEEEEEDDD